MTKWIISILILPFILICLKTFSFYFNSTVALTLGIVLIALYILVIKKVLWKNTPWYKDNAKVIIIIFCAIFYSYSLINLFKRTADFRFDDFKLNEVAQVYFKQRYPENSNVYKVIGDLKRAGATCAEHINIDSHISHDALRFDKVFVCTHYSGLFSFDPYKKTTLELYADRANQIIKVHAEKESW